MEFIAHNFISYHFQEGNFFRYPEIIQEMPAEELRSYLDFFDLDRAAISIVRPR